MSKLPPLAVLVSHTVSDFDAWKRAFDAHQPARKAAGILGHHLNLGADGAVSVYLPALDRAQLAAFLESSDLKDAMKSGAVTSAPQIAWLKPIEDSHIADRALAGMIIDHSVTSFAAWKKIYDSVGALRHDAGIVGAAVNQSLDDANHVVVYHQAETEAALQRFVASAELKAAMQAGGVTAPPQIRFVRSMPGAAY
ncbi:MAG: putative quinol monooxygenase [Polyangiales bacterium]